MTHEAVVEAWAHVFPMLPPGARMFFAASRLGSVTDDNVEMVFPRDHEFGPTLVDCAREAVGLLRQYLEQGVGLEIVVEAPK